MRVKLGSCLLVVLLLMAATSTQARVDSNPIKVRLVGELPQAKAWQAIDGVFELESAADVELTNLQFKSNGWQIVKLDAPSTVALRKGETLEIPFRAVPQDPSAPLGLAYDVNGRSYRARVHTASSTVMPKSSMGRLVPKDGSSKEYQWPAKIHPGPDGDDPGVVEVVDLNDTTGNPSKRARSIRVLGRFEYVRDDNVWEPAGHLHYEIYDADTGADELLASGTIPDDGQLDRTFTWDPCGVCDSNPDIYIEVVAQNSFLDVQTSIVEWTYGWDTYTVHDYTGNLLQFSTMAMDAHRFAAHCFRTVWRGFFFWDLQGYAMNPVDVQIPDSDGSFYNDWFEEIHIGEGRQWEEGSYLHEFGHHWQDRYTQTIDPEYDNGYCDDPDPGHCSWCQEHTETAEQEGWANFLSWQIGSEINRVWDPDIQHLRHFPEVPGLACTDNSGNPCPCDPMSTEGFYTAFLTDLADADNENDTNRDANWWDVTTLNPWTIIVIADLENPASMWDWWADLKAYFPNDVENMYETARNCGIEFDYTLPPAPISLHSPSHDGVGASPDATIWFQWTAPHDVDSGVAGYDYAIHEGSAVAPGYNVDIGDYETFTTDPLPPGDWYFTLRTIDRAGNGSSSYATRGPITIREPYLSDLQFSATGDWTQAVLPYNAVYSETGPPPQPTTLPGWVTGTYWNYKGKNNGESSIPETFYNRLLVDGEPVDENYLGGGSPWMEFAFKNRGPVAVPSGRHTFEVALDVNEVVPETNETNNHLGYQYTWEPMMLTLDSILNTWPPPDPTGGWPSVPTGKWYNVNGYRFDSGAGSGYWSAVYMLSIDLEADYALRMHPASTAATNGFGSNVAYSGRPPGCTEAVIANRNHAGTVDWDVGVLYTSGVDDSNIQLRHVDSTYLGTQGSATLSWGAAILMDLYEFRVLDTAAGAVSITLQIDTPDYHAPVYVAWLDEDFVTGDLLGARQTVTTDWNGFAHMDLDIERVGYHGIAVYRDPKDGYQVLNGELNVFQTPVDFVPFAPTGWYASLVPRTFHANTPFAVSAPDTLHGNTSPMDAEGTWINISAKNEGPPDAANVPSMVYLDGVARWSHEWIVLLSGIAEKLNWDVKRSVRGGRHTLGFVVDDPDGSVEMSEENNAYAEQWVWSPLPLSIGGTTARTYPPDRMGGRDLLEVDEPAWYNSDGLRMPKPSPTHDGDWQVLAVMPGTSSNVDVRLHFPQPGVKDGFAQYPTASWWGPGQLDYLLVNNYKTALSAFDVSVISESGSQSYNAHLVSSIDLGVPPVGSHGPYTIGDGELIHAFDAYLNTGDYTIRVRPGRFGSSVQWGVAIHENGQSYQCRSMIMAEGSAWFNGPGEEESITIHIPRRDHYCVTVFKATAGSTHESGDYHLDILDAVIAAPELPQVTATRIVGARPNPFNPQTTIAFEMARAGRVEIELFDLSGKRVRSLLSEHRSPGRYDVQWNGRDDHGREVASGTYFVRMKAGAVVDREKVVLIK